MRKIIIFLLLKAGMVLGVRHTLVDIEKVCPSIRLDIKYATKDNFTQCPVYKQPKAYLQKGTADKLMRAQIEFQKMGYGIKIWDAYRPRSVQYEFWKLVPDVRYVADPQKGSKHNRGSAVDITLVDKNGVELEMPSAFDDFSEKAHRACKDATACAKKNCILLGRVMRKHGFKEQPTEWWHFDDSDWQKYDLLDIPFEDL